ncbi:hypothetical protein [Pedobacter glucosidilyticus]|uniref:hypothetical protein n=1 Tax=Pedobacter glucosidilyticus TaxID=1122941 RepID=UPI0026EC6F46|nr:hypothetical protein [Pedobacter glucosidilyticus]
MKNNFTLFLLLTITTFIGCKKDNNTLDTRLKGRWDAKSFVHEEFINGVLQQPKPNEIHYSSTKYIIFTDNEASFYDKNDILIEQWTYTLKDDKITFKQYDITTVFPIKFNGADEFFTVFRYDISIQNKEYAINTSTYTRSK